MRLSRKGAELIAGFEGFVPRPYNDAAGHATIGFGHLLHRGPVTATDKARWGTISRDRGIALLLQDAREAERAVAEAVRVTLTQEQFDALVSFVFNVGAGAFRSSTLLKKLNRGDEREAADELLRWTRAGGRVLEGLLRRRRAERALFLLNPLKDLTPRERRLVQEYDRLRPGDPRRRVLRKAMREQLRRIRQAAERSGWARVSRRARYRVLAGRTR